MDSELISVVVGFVMPPVVEFINARIKWERVRFLVSILVCLIVGIVITYFIGDYSSMEELTQNAGAVFIASQGAYYAYFKKSKMDTTINRVMN